MWWRRAGAGNHAVCLQLSLSGEHKNSWVLCALRGVARASCRNLASWARPPGSLAHSPGPSYRRVSAAGQAPHFRPSHQQHLAFKATIEENSQKLILHYVCRAFTAACLLLAWSAFTFKEWGNAMQCIYCTDDWDIKTTAYFNLCLLHFKLVDVHFASILTLSRVILCEWCCRFILGGWLWGAVAVHSVEEQLQQ